MKFSRKLLWCLCLHLITTNALAGSAASSGSASEESDTPSTSFDFSGSTLDGQMKAPDGFFLQGRKQQTLTQMVKLRPHFKTELRNSKAAVRALVK